MPSSSWKESLDDDEEEQFLAAAQRVKSLQQTFARRGDGNVNRGFHVKAHAGLRGTLRVLNDVPEFARHGLFAKPQTFDAHVRFSNGFSSAQRDIFPDLRGMAVRVLGVEGPRLLPDEAPRPEQDLIGLSVSYIPFRDATDFAVISTAASVSPLTAIVPIMKQMGIIGGIRIVLWGLRLVPPIRSVASLAYFSNLPMTIGPLAAKFAWVPRERARFRFPSLKRDYLRAELARRLSRGDIKYDFMVQFYTDDKRTPIERGAYAWKTSDAPYVRLAELTIPRQDIGSAEALELNEALRNTAFNPWNGITAHRPLGNTQRGRKVIYQASAALRGSKHEAK
jgi:hypothetical protein